MSAWFLDSELSTCLWFNVDLYPCGLRYAKSNCIMYTVL